MAEARVPRLRPCHDDLIVDICNDIEERAVPEYTHVTGTRQDVQHRHRFLPIDRLRDIFPIEIVRNVLNHSCDNCANHVSRVRTAQPSQYPAERILNSPEALSLFALLVLLKYPLLIGCFLIYYPDEKMPQPRYFSQQDLRDRQFKHLSNDTPKRQLLAEFQEKKWRFSVPSFVDGTFQIYEEEMLLPYLDEEPIGKGGYSNVYKVSVHPMYCTLEQMPASSERTREPEPKILVRKEIKDLDAIEFVNERTNLQQISTLRHPNLVRIMKTYQLGEKFNILFPYAKTNLHQYLRDRRWRAPQSVNLSRSRLWDQVLGVTEALSKIITFVDPEEPGRILFGFHLDLKPSNILIDGETTVSKDLFKITDFGQTQFIDPAFAETTKVIGGGGTDAYAPPEYLGPHQNHVYDVWSLGIIILEIFAFAVRDVDGLIHEEFGLDNVRFTVEAGVKNSRFYTRDNESGQWVLKCQIVAWIESLMQYASEKFPESRVFISELRGLIKQMLEPDMKKRIVISQVLSQMRTIFKVVNAEPDRDQADVLREQDERILVDERQVDFYPKGVFNRTSHLSSFIILENSKQSLRIFAGNHIRGACNRRQDMKLVPSFQHTVDVQNGRFELRFASAKEEETVSLQGVSFIVHNENLARRLQMALTNHTVSPQRFRLLTMDLRKYIQPMKRVTDKVKVSLRHLTRPSDSTHQSPKLASSDTFIPFWIELWLENQPRYPNPPVLKHETPASGTGRRLNRQSNPTKEVPLGRVVMFCQKKILIIPFAKESQLKKNLRRNELRDSSLTFECMDKRQRDSFRMYQIEATANDFLPGIPMHHPILYELEKESEFECESLTVKFDQWKEAVSFEQLYRNEKARWLHLIKDETPPNPSLMTGV